jgi:spore germination cell wall hydrolase CwlJ-like protein
LSAAKGKEIELKNIFGRRVLTAAAGLFTVVMSSGASAATPVQATFQPAVQNINYSISKSSAVSVANSVPTPVQQGQGTAAQAASIANPISMITNAPALMRQSLPLASIVQSNVSGAPLDEQGNCLATAVYFESRGEPVEGQLAVADVVMNRASSGRYPSDWCSVVKQKAQFSFVQNGRFPAITDAYSWQMAQAVARTAILNMARELPTDVLWYHANYVSPSWRNNLELVEKIGAHIFYRA